MAYFQESNLAGITLVAFDHPPVNAFNRAFLSALSQRLHDFNQAPSEGLLLTGSARGYSAGLDIKELLTLDAAGISELLGLFFNTLKLVASCPVPVVVAINGTAPAGGAVLSLCADARIMSDAHTIGFNEVAVGLTPGPLVLGLLTRLIGLRLATEALTTGEFYNALEAKALGLISECVKPERVLAESQAWIEHRLGLPRHAYLSTRSMARGDLMPLFDTIKVSSLIEAWTQSEVKTTLMTRLSMKSTAN